MRRNESQAVDSANFEQSLKKYFPYLLEIRRRLLFTLCMFLIVGSLGFIYYAKILSLIVQFFKLEGINIVFTSPFQFLSLAFTCGLLAGSIVIFPVIVHQILSFIKPALHPREYKVVLSLLPLSILLFVAGFAFGIIIMRYILIIFYQKSVELAIGNFLDISLLLSQVLLTGVMMGIGFQFPIVLTLLMRMGVIKHRMLERSRLFAWGASLIFAAVLPPTDLLSLVLLTMPLIALFELTLLLNRVFLKTHLL